MSIMPQRAAAWTQPAAIVYPAFTMAAYAVIRNLGERGIPVVALNPWRHPHMRSRWVTPAYSPNLAEAPEEFFAFLAQIAAELPQGGVLYLMEDVYVYLAHQFRDRLPANIRFPLMDDEALAMSLDKRAMFDAAERAGVPLPWTMYPTGLAELEAVRASIPFPCLIKPLVSRFSFGAGAEARAIELFPKTFGGKCARADDFDGLRGLVARALGLGIPICIQELLEGPIDQIYGVHLYADARHEILGMATGRKLRQVPGDFGTGSLCEAVESAELEELARRFVKEARFYGIGGLEFKRDARDGSWKLIEINPRGVHWLGLSLVAGVELPYLKYRDLLGQPVRQTQRDFSARWVDGKGDWRYWTLYRRASGSPFHITWQGWLLPLLGARPAVLNWKDPVPGLVGLIPSFVGSRYLALRTRWTS